VALPVVAKLPAQPGVYRFRDERGRVLYLGRATDLRRRVASYWGGLADRRHLRRMVPRISTVEAVVCDSTHEAAWLERNLLEHSKPYWNRSRGGQEVPVYLRLGPRGLTIVHEHEAGPGLFGPYLGGAKVRLAVSALDRALPVAYAADGLRGFSADLSRVRGVTDHSGLMTAVAATLARDQSTIDSVRATLARRRDGAAAALAFELAARAQEEIEALDWVTAAQRVTASTMDDADVYGWDSGVLVHFEVRGGRLRRWTQSSSAEPVAAGRIAATPPAWHDFAARAAALAARLAEV
jgi:excinuclease ABC subunit C